MAGRYGRKLGRIAVVALPLLALVPIGLRVASMVAPGLGAAPPAAAPVAASPRPAATRTVARSATADGFVVRRVLPVSGPIRVGNWVWNDEGVPAGPLVITVDLQAGVLSAFRDGYEIGTAAILYGADEKPTPLGVFPILAKDAHHFSSSYNRAPMPYTLRLTADGVSVHGSPDMNPKWATHGCVGLPIAFAKRLFDQAHVGDRVIITNGKRMATGDRIIAA